MDFLNNTLCDVAYRFSLKFSQTFRSWLLNLIPWLNFRPITRLFRSVCTALDKGLYFGMCTCVHFWKLRGTPVYTLFLNGFPLMNFLQIVSLKKCPFYHIYLECTYDINQKYLKRCFLIIYLKHILKIFLKRYFSLKVRMHTQAWTSRS